MGFSFFGCRRLLLRRRLAPSLLLLFRRCLGLGGCRLRRRVALGGASTRFLRFRGYCFSSLIAIVSACRSWRSGGFTLLACLGAWGATGSATSSITVEMEAFIFIGFALLGFVFCFFGGLAVAFGLDGEVGLFLDDVVAGAGEVHGWVGGRAGCFDSVAAGGLDGEVAVGLLFGDFAGWVGAVPGPGCWSGRLAWVVVDLDMNGNVNVVGRRVFE